MNFRFLPILAALCCLSSAATLRAQNSAFTYQGRLATNNTPATGRYDMQFVLFAVESGGSPSLSRSSFQTSVSPTDFSRWRWILERTRSRASIAGCKSPFARQAADR
jgi:hypothetical protein